MGRRVLAGLIVCAALIGAGSQLVLGQSRGTPSSDQAESVPAFQVDPTWPKLPNNWVVGVASSVTVDSHDNVWLIHRPRTVPAEDKDRAAPAVLEFDSKGNFIQAWGGPGDGYQWPATEHSVFVDDKDQVWICGSGAGDDVLLKFTAKGKFLMQLGKRGASTGNSDTKNLNRPADISVNVKTNEVLVADGYGNHRIIVYDADTLAFKRMWGAFGNTPIDRPAEDTRAMDPADLTAPQFDVVHGAKVSHDGHVYVADRTQRRIQVFTLDGKYVSQVLINPEGPTGMGAPLVYQLSRQQQLKLTAAGIAFSPDAGQRFIYVADYANSQILTVDRKTLKVLSFFGARGANPGDFQGVHHMAADSKGNLYTAEVAPGNRFQKFVPTGRRPASTR